MPIIQQGKNCLFLNLPKEYMQLLGWKKGTQVVVYPAPNEKQALLVKEMPKQK